MAEPMHPVDLLEETLESYLIYSGRHADIRQWLLEQNKRIHDNGIKVNDSLGHPADEYIRSSELRARWLLGSLRDIFLSDLRGMQMIATVGPWAAEAKKALIAAGIIADDGDPSLPRMEPAKGRAAGQGYSQAIAVDEVAKHADQWANALKKHKTSTNETAS